MKRTSLRFWISLCLSVSCAMTALLATSTQPARAAGSDRIVVKIASVEDKDEDPFAAGKAAAESLKRMMGDAEYMVEECMDWVEDIQTRTQTPLFLE